MPAKNRPSTTRRAPSNAKIFVKIAGVWVAMICGSFLLGWLVVSPLMRAASASEKRPTESSEVPSSTPHTAQVDNSAPPQRRAPGPSINIAPDEQQQAIQEPETDVTEPAQQPDSDTETQSGVQVQTPQDNTGQAEPVKPRRRLDGNDLSVESDPAPARHETSSERNPATTHTEPSPRTRSKQPVQKSDSID